MSYVLVVDDKEENRYYLQALLGGHGFNVVVARHGAEALALVRARADGQPGKQSSPVMVISDLLMPVMDGYTLLRHWKADPELRGLPFIVYTATYTQDEDKKLAMDLGADAFILKPAEPEDFLAKMREVLARPAKSGFTASESGDPDETSETDVLKHYSEALIRKLEEKSVQLAESNRLLELDIVRRQKAEADLRDSEERFRLLARATNDAIWDWDIRQDTRWWGDGFAQLFGYDHNNRLSSNRAWTDLIHADDKERVTGSLGAAIDHADSWQASYRLKKADGSWACVEDRGQLIRDSSGTAIRMVGGLTDVSRRTALEERLRSSQRLEAVGQLTGGIAHDFNNLLTIVLGNAETLSELLERDVKKRELARMIVGAAERGAELTQRLLAFARKQSLTPRAVDINQLLQGLNLMLERVVGAAVVLEFHPGKYLPAALVDASQLEHSVLNLCVNARDAMPAGGTVTIATSHVRYDQDTQLDTQWIPAGSYICLTVADTGCGISRENIARIFEPFFSTKPEGKGAGLGLAMVYGFVQQSGGHILVDSGGDMEGTCFSLYLPLASGLADGGTERNAEDSTAVVSSSDVPGGTERILLVEDDALVRKIAEHNLVSLGYQVVVASGGESALSLLRSMASKGEPIDLLFTDVRMSGMTGPELAEQAVSLQPDLRVLYTSGYTAQHVVPGSQWPVLHKPYRRAELAAQISAAFGRQSEQVLS